MNIKRPVNTQMVNILANAILTIHYVPVLHLQNHYIYTHIQVYIIYIHSLNDYIGGDQTHNVLI